MFLSVISQIFIITDIFITPIRCLYNSHYFLIDLHYRFVQDDAHIFCRLDQIKTVITECLEFLNDVYLALNFKYRVVLSTRPDVFMGSIKKWNEAEEGMVVIAPRKKKK
jgi:hypothetical protein